MRRFKFRDDKSAKFWSIDLQGKSFTVRFGKIGTAGQTQTKDFAET
jgi:predicted DNA-binding WGR domain protein